MTVKQLAAKDKGLQSIEVTDQNIGSFNRIARKYGIDFAPFKEMCIRDSRSSELFKQRATLLYEDVGDSYIGTVFAARSMELWLLEDMGDVYKRQEFAAFEQ